MDSPDPTIVRNQLPGLTLTICSMRKGPPLPYQGLEPQEQPDMGLLDVLLDHRSEPARQLVAELLHALGPGLPAEVDIWLRKNLTVVEGRLPKVLVKSLKGVVRLVDLLKQRFTPHSGIA